jgi:tRNA-splicing ligase RtcB (3'-phosphate/5'-hydroxy nucleic acid ligase)
MIHSGSRNLGKKVADHYHKIAKNMNEKWFSNIPEKSDLNFLPTDSIEGQKYIKEMNFCVEYAYQNRLLMLYQTIDAIKNCAKKYDGVNVGFDDFINIAHNYARIENHFGQNVWIHRKGATSARLNEIGIIPGSQGTASHIVRGLGNVQSFQSCSHGAGRTMGRKEAQRVLDLATEIKKLDDQGIIHSIHTADDLDEAAGAYKDIGTVMKNQEDLVEVIKTLKPVAVIKG